MHAKVLEHEGPISTEFFVANILSQFEMVLSSLLFCKCNHIFYFKNFLYEERKYNCNMLLGKWKCLDICLWNAAHISFLKSNTVNLLSLTSTIPQFIQVFAALIQPVMKVIDNALLAWMHKFVLSYILLNWVLSSFHHSFIIFLYPKGFPMKFSLSHSLQMHMQLWPIIFSASLASLVNFFFTSYCYTSTLSLRI